MNKENPFDKLRKHPQYQSSKDETLASKEDQEQIPDVREHEAAKTLEEHLADTAKKLAEIDEIETHARAIAPRLVPNDETTEWDDEINRLTGTFLLFVGKARKDRLALQSCLDEGKIPESKDRENAEQSLGRLRERYQEIVAYAKEHGVALEDADADEVAEDEALTTETVTTLQPNEQPYVVTQTGRADISPELMERFGPNREKIVSKQSSSSKKEEYVAPADLEKQLTYEEAKARWAEARKVSDTLGKEFESKYRIYLRSKEEKGVFSMSGLAHKLERWFGNDTGLNDELHDLHQRTIESRRVYFEAAKQLARYKESAEDEVLKRYQAMLAYKLTESVYRRRVDIAKEEAEYAFMKSPLSFINRGLRSAVGGIRKGAEAARLDEEAVDRAFRYITPAIIGSIILLKGMPAVVGLGTRFGTQVLGNNLFTKPLERKTKKLTTQLGSNLFDKDGTTFVKLEAQIDKGVKLQDGSRRLVDTTSKLSGFAASLGTGLSGESQPIDSATAPQLESNVPDVSYGDISNSNTLEAVSPIESTPSTPPEATAPPGEIIAPQPPVHATVTPQPEVESAPLGNGVEATPDQYPDPLQKQTVPEVDSSPDTTESELAGESEKIEPDTQPDVNAGGLRDMHGNLETPETLFGWHKMPEGGNFWQMAMNKVEGMPPITSFDWIGRWDQWHLQELIDLTREAIEANPELLQKFGFIGDLDHIEANQLVPMHVLDHYVRGIAQAAGFSVPSSVGMPELPPNIAELLDQQVKIGAEHLHATGRI
ncbi:hypothetical protein KC722_00320 [Candidatus Kaiserbacteria bacterium]|nr:hypothetical protein [Candidatus Kaiserbacteria bacterium]MCB9811960.1 hypothetical protein [Candidatus Nomurabacteria bacterium]